MARRKKGQLKSGNIRVQVYDYTDSAGKRHYQSFTAPTRAEAEAKANDWKEQRRQLKEAISVSEAVRRYIDLKEAVLSPATVRAYRYYLAQHFSGKFGAINLRDLHNIEAQQWVSDMSKDLSAKTVRNVAGLFSAAIDMFVPNLRLKLTLPRQTKPDLHCPSFEEVMTIYHHAKSQELKTAILLGSIGAMRRGEICAVTFSDLRDGYLTINKAYVQDSERHWILKAPKTYSSYRQIKLPGLIIDAILALPAPHTGRIVPITPDVLSNRFQRAIRSSGLPHFRFHDLRHFGASMLIGFGDRYVEQYGGWQAGSTVMKKIYQNFIDVEKRKADDEMAAMFQRKLVQHITRTATHRNESKNITPVEARIC